MQDKDLYCNFHYSLLGIETLITPICFDNESHCNFHYSLLGIETFDRQKHKEAEGGIAIFITPY